MIVYIACKSFVYSYRPLFCPTCVPATYARVVSVSYGVQIYSFQQVFFEKYDPIKGKGVVIMISDLYRE